MRIETIHCAASWTEAASKSRSCQNNCSWHTGLRMRLHAIVGCCLLATFSSTLIGVVQAQGPAPSPLTSAPSPPPEKVSAAAPQPSPAAELTKADFETFLDALIPSQLRNRNIAGAVVSVVKDGQVLFQKGYGYADFEAKKPVLPDADFVPSWFDFEIVHCHSRDAASGARQTRP